MKRNQAKIKKVISNNATLFALIIVLIIASLTVDSFCTVINFMNLLKQSCTTGIMAIGMSFVIISGGIDLSVGSIYAFSGVVCGLFMNHVADSPVLGTIAAVAVCTLIGAINGFCIVKLKIAAFITTLCMMNGIYGLGMALTDGGKSIPIEGNFFNWLSWGQIGIFPVAGILLILSYVLAGVAGKYREFGRDCYAIGGNSTAALMKGVPVDRVKILSYTVLGFCAGIAGIIVSTRTGTGQISVGAGQEMDVIAACVIGGIALSGGEGRPVNALWGVFIINIIGNIINRMANISFLLQGCITGAIMIVILLVQSQIAGSRDMVQS